MAKEKRSAADLDAELAALEAELAALEGKATQKLSKKPAKPEPAPEPAPAAAPQEAPQKEAKKGRFSLPLKRGRKAEAPPEPAPEAPAAPAPFASPAEATPPPPPPQAFDPALWRREGDAWVRVVPDTPVPVVRRVLDEEGNLVREEPATQRDVDEATGVKAERGLGRLLRRRSG